MSERRERWALVFSKLDGWREGHVRDHGQHQEYYAAADAAMALADEELSYWKAKLSAVTEGRDSLKSEAARLRAELESLRDDKERLGSELNAKGYELDAARAELESLRDEYTGYRGATTRLIEHVASNRTGRALVAAFHRKWETK